MLILESPRPLLKGLFPPEEGRLRVDGRTFLTEKGELFQWRGYSWFLGFLRYCRGEDVTPDLWWMRMHGVNMPRIFGPLPWKETPDYRVEHFAFDKLPAFLQLLQDFGLRSNWSLGHNRHLDLRPFVRRWFDIAKDFWSPVAEAVNEPHVGSEKPDPMALMYGLDRHGVLTSYGLYGSYYAKPSTTPPVLDFGTIHILRDSAWHRKARHAQELQDATGKPWISDEPAKIVEPWFDYPGAKNDPRMTPAEMAWHAGVCHLWTPGVTIHTEEGKWGRVPEAGSLQMMAVDAVRDHVWTRIGPEVQTGEYNRGGNGDSPVDNVYVEKTNEVWTYTSLHDEDNAAVTVRCGLSEPQTRLGWRAVERWGPGNSFVRLER